MWGHHWQQVQYIVKIFCWRSFKRNNRIIELKDFVSANKYLEIAIPFKTQCYIPLAFPCAKWKLLNGRWDMKLSVKTWGELSDLFTDSQNISSGVIPSEVRTEEICCNDFQECRTDEELKKNVIQSFFFSETKPRSTAVKCTCGQCWYAGVGMNIG